MPNLTDQIEALHCLMIDRERSLVETAALVENNELLALRLTTMSEAYGHCKDELDAILEPLRPIPRTGEQK